MAGQFLVMTAHCLPILVLSISFHQNTPLTQFPVALSTWIFLPPDPSLSFPFSFVPSRCPILVANLLQFCLQTNPAFPIKPCSTSGPFIPSWHQLWFVNPICPVWMLLYCTNNGTTLSGVFFHSSPPLYDHVEQHLQIPLSTWILQFWEHHEMLLSADILITEFPQKLCETVAEGSFLKAA